MSEIPLREYSCVCASIEGEIMAIPRGDFLSRIKDRGSGEHIIKKNELTVAYITGNGLKTQEAVIDAVGRPTRIQPSLVAFEKTFKLGKNGGGDA